MSNEQNATSNRPSLLDRIHLFRKFAKSAGWSDLAEWLTKHADEPCPAAIAQFMEMDGTPPSEPSRTDAVEKAIAYFRDGHLGCRSDICTSLKMIRVITAALADAERKLAANDTTIRELRALVIVHVDALAEVQQRLAAAEKRAKDAETDVEHVARVRDLNCGKFIAANDRNAALTRKLAAALKALKWYANAEYNSRTDSDVQLQSMADYALVDLAAIDAPEGEEAEEIAPRIIDGKFMAAVQENAGRRRVVIIKTSSGEIVPEDEPLMLQRGRDHLMVATLNHYRKLSQLDGCNDYHMAGVDRVIERFTAYASDPSRMKQPGITRGAAWNPDAQAVEEAPIPPGGKCPECGGVTYGTREVHLSDCSRWMQAVSPEREVPHLHAPDFKEGDCETRDCHLDPGVAEIVYGLWEAGVQTATSCEGGGPEKGHGRLERIVTFGWNDLLAGPQAYKAAKSLGMPAFMLQQCWPDSGCGRGEGSFYWEIMFDRWTSWTRPAGTAPPPEPANAKTSIRYHVDFWEDASK